MAKRGFRRNLLNGGHIALILACAPWLYAAPSKAQSAAAVPVGQAAPVEEITVTGSRAATISLTAPSPTTVLNSIDFAVVQSPDIATILNQSPAFKADSGAETTNGKPALIGTTQADLRGLGAARTLFLVDGQRIAPVAPSSASTNSPVAPDMNTVPSLLVDRVEIVTGGASAEWGSDAVAGVVNIRLRDKYEGFEYKIQGGESQYGDSGDVLISAIGGTSFADDLGHVVLAMEYERNGGIGDIYTRPWGRQEYAVVGNSSVATNGLPLNVLAPNVHVATSGGGLITTKNFAYTNYYFTSANTLTPFQFGSLPGSNMIGGQGISPYANVSLQPKSDRFDPYLIASYDVTDHIKAVFRASYAYSNGTAVGIPASDSADSVSIANPFLPSAVVAAMTAAHLSTITVSRIDYDVAIGRTTDENTAPHVSLQLKGDIPYLAGDWNWDASYSFGQNNYDQTVANDQIKANYAFARNAVVSNGQIVCAATVAGSAAYNPAAAGCVPINIFGQGSPSPAAIAYSVGTEHDRTIYAQHDVQANLKGEPFSTWAGPVSLAAGIEYRSESETVQSDSIAAVGGYTTGNPLPLTGSFNVAEGYLDVIAPLAKDTAFAKSLNVNGAIRVSSYSDVGLHETWKVGTTYEPPVVDGLLLRLMYSDDLRAPAIWELDGKGSVTNQAITVNGISVSSIPQNISLGNPNLGPETARTITVGGVYAPPAISGLRLSLDYYDINLKDAITTLPATSIANLCSAGNAYACSLLSFSGGVPTALNATTINAAGLESIGLDFAATYRTPLASIIDGLPGDLKTSLGATYVMHSYVNLGGGAATVDRAGENSSVNIGAIPRMRLNFTGTYEIDRLALTTQVLFVSAGHYDNSFTPQTINNNHVSQYANLNLFASYDVTEDGNIRAFAGLKNVFNVVPPPVPTISGSVVTNAQYYDVVGRYFQAGLSMRF